MKIILSASLTAVLLLFVVGTANSAATCSFTAGTLSGPVCDILVRMHPISPGSTAALSLSGNNTGKFHLAGPGCSNISLGACSIQQSSAIGGTPPGDYVDVSAVATQAGIINSPFRQPLVLSGAAAPVMASISSSPASFTAQSGNANATVGTLLVTTVPISPTGFSGTLALATASGCPGANNSSFVISGNQLKIGASNITTPATYSICVRATDAAYTNSPFFQTVTLTGQSVGACSGTQVVTDASTYAPGVPITVTTCGGSGNPGDWVQIVSHSNNYGGGGVTDGKYAKYLGVTTSGATVTLASPSAKFDRDLPVHIVWYASGGFNHIAESATIILQKTINPPAPVAVLPSRLAADPFIPQHVVTVCASGCTYTSLGDATNATSGAGWDFVQIKIFSGEYVFPASPFGNSYVPHLWIKGVGTTMPHLWGNLWGTDQGILATDIYRDPGGSVTIDNLEIGPWPYWAIIQHDTTPWTLRNVYVHDAFEGMITGNAADFTLNIYNSVFARSGSGIGPEHDLYVGDGNHDRGGQGDTVNIENSVFESAVVGHSLKSRAKINNLTCSMFAINQDDVWNGSETIDMDSGQPNLTSILSVNGAGPTKSYTDLNSWDNVRYTIDHANNIHPAIPAINGSTFVADQPFSFHNFVSVGMKFDSHVTWSNNKFVWPDSFSRPHGPTGDLVYDLTGVLYQSNNPAATGDVNDVTLDGTNSYFTSREDAGFPSVGTYPKGWRDYLSMMPAACTEPVGNVAVPPS